MMSTLRFFHLCDFVSGHDINIYFTMIHFPELISVLINSPTHHHHHHHQSGKWRTVSLLVFSLDVSMSGHQRNVFIKEQRDDRRRTVASLTHYKYQELLSSCPFISSSHIMISASLHFTSDQSIISIIPSIDGTFNVRSVECFQVGLCFCDRSNIIF